MYPWTAVVEHNAEYRDYVQADQLRLDEQVSPEAPAALDDGQSTHAEIPSSPLPLGGGQQAEGTAHPLPPRGGGLGRGASPQTNLESKPIAPGSALNIVRSFVLSAVSKN